MAFEYRDKFIAYFYPDARSEEQFVADAKDQAGAEGPGWPFFIVSLRGGIPAEVTDRHDGSASSGPAAVSWIEDGYLISLIGHGGQTLQDLIQMAEDMEPSASAAP